MLDARSCEENISKTVVPCRVSAYKCSSQLFFSSDDTPAAAAAVANSECGVCARTQMMLVMCVLLSHNVYISTELNYEYSNRWSKDNDVLYVHNGKYNRQASACPYP